MAGLDGPGHAGALAIARFPDVGNALAVTAREGGRVARPRSEWNFSTPTMTLQHDKALMWCFTVCSGCFWACCSATLPEFTHFGGERFPLTPPYGCRSGGARGGLPVPRDLFPQGVDAAHRVGRAHPIRPLPGRVGAACVLRAQGCRVLFSSPTWEYHASTCVNKGSSRGMRTGWVIDKESRMSGHSKWATTKHRKGAQDAKRSALFSKLSRNITVAARLGNDPNPDNNASLAAAVAKAKAQSMPKDKIKSAIDKGLRRRCRCPPCTRTSSTRATVLWASPCSSSA